MTDVKLFELILALAICKDKKHFREYLGNASFTKE